MTTYTNSSPGMLWRFDLVARSFLAQPGLPLANAPPEERIAQAFAAEEIDFGGTADDQRDVIYTPAARQDRCSAAYSICERKAHSVTAGV